MNQIKLNIPSAADALKAIENGQYAKAEKQAAEIEVAIVKAISLGQKNAGGSGWLEPSVKAALTESRANRKGL